MIDEIRKIIFSIKKEISKEIKLPKDLREKCCAKTRKGTPCKAPSVWDGLTERTRNGRCKLHGGKYTGPRTEAGKEAIRASNRRRKEERNCKNM